MADRLKNAVVVGERRRVLALAILILGGICGATSATGADTAKDGRLAWSTYLRSGPSSTATVLDELEHDTPVRIGACTAKWCRVSAGGLEGFVDRDALHLTPPPRPQGQAGAPCVVAGQTDARRPRPTRFCAGT